MDIYKVFLLEVKINRYVSVRLKLCKDMKNLFWCGSAGNLRAIFSRGRNLEYMREENPFCRTISWKNSFRYIVHSLDENNGDMRVPFKEEDLNHIC